jgi:hypothetical protein
MSNCHSSRHGGDKRASLGEFAREANVVVACARLLFSWIRVESAMDYSSAFVIPLTLEFSSLEVQSRRDDVDNTSSVGEGLPSAGHVPDTLHVERIIGSKRLFFSLIKIVIT